MFGLFLSIIPCTILSRHSSAQHNLIKVFMNIFFFLIIDRFELSSHYISYFALATVKTPC